METQIEWFESQNMQYGKFTFDDLSNTQSNENLIVDWKKRFAAKSREKFSLIWDCTELHDYESACKILWQETVRQNLHQIDRIWIISNPEIVKAFPYLMCFFEKINFKMICVGGNVYKISHQSAPTSTFIN